MGMHNRTQRSINWSPCIDVQHCLMLSRLPTVAKWLAESSVDPPAGYGMRIMEAMAYGCIPVIVQVCKCCARGRSALWLRHSCNLTQGTHTRSQRQARPVRSN